LNSPKHDFFFLIEADEDLKWVRFNHFEKGIAGFSSQFSLRRFFNNLIRIPSQPS